MALIECVPNISEGRDQALLDDLAELLRGAEGVRLLDVDPGADTNRTVFTFVGAPEPLLDAAFRFFAAVAARVDMRGHSGAHPRHGAVDVCPFVPVRDVTMDDCAALARRLGERVGGELGIPVYLYEAAASAPERRNLAVLRAGEYEGLAAKMKEIPPDFGPSELTEAVARTGATTIGARPFLAAYNINLNTRSRRLAHNVALDLRERGRWLRDESGAIARDSEGSKLRKDGLLKGVKAVGWHIEEYDRAQISMNLTDLSATPLHRAFIAAEEQARTYGLRVTGSELVGLIPRDSMLAAGRYFLEQQGRSTGIPERDIVETAIQSLGLRELSAFDPSTRIIEYAVAEAAPLASLTVTGFVNETMRDSPAPGGGSVAALAGALGAALAGMVANLTAESKAHKHNHAAARALASRAAELAARLTDAVDADTRAFDAVLAARRRSSDDPDKRAAVHDAMVGAIRVPLGVVRDAAAVVECAELAAEIGLEAARSDAGVAARMAVAAAEAAYDNVLINLAELAPEATEQSLREEAESALVKARSGGAAVAESVRAALREGLS